MNILPLGRNNTNLECNIIEYAYHNVGGIYNKPLCNYNDRNSMFILLTNATHNKLKAKCVTEI